MLKKPYKSIKQDNGTLDIYGNNHWIELDYQVPEWNNDKPDADVEACFKYKGNLYFLSEIMAVNNPIYNPNPPEWMKGFDGYMSDSFFSGILIKLSDEGDMVKVYTFLS